jgi:hypothetical protein
MGTTYHTIALGNVEVWGTQNSARTTNQPRPSVFLQIRLR